MHDSQHLPTIRTPAQALESSAQKPATIVSENTANEAGSNDATVKLAPDKPPLRLDLGCGQNIKEGFEGVDYRARNAKHRVDLFKFPWPWDDESVDELHASHFVEHIPNRDVEERDIVRVPYEIKPGWIASSDGAFHSRAEEFLGKDMFFAFMDECHRILKKDGRMKVIVPALQSSRAFQDPTHRRFIPAEYFKYVTALGRKEMGLEHYNVRCDFQVHVNHTCLEEFNLLTAEAAARRFREGWNTMFDLHFDLVKI